MQWSNFMLQTIIAKKAIRHIDELLTYKQAKVITIPFSYFPIVYMDLKGAKMSPSIGRVENRRNPEAILTPYCSRVCDNSRPVTAIVVAGHSCSAPKTGALGLND
jgi:hypothetical protein